MLHFTVCFFLLLLALFLSFKLFACKYSTRNGRRGEVINQDKLLWSSRIEPKSTAMSWTNRKNYIHVWYTMLSRQVNWNPHCTVSPITYSNALDPIDSYYNLLHFFMAASRCQGIYPFSFSFFLYIVVGTRVSQKQMILMILHYLSTLCRSNKMIITRLEYRTIQSIFQMCT